jgi:hypothetical protein
VRVGLESRLKVLEARAGSQATAEQKNERRAWAAAWEGEVVAALKRAEEQGTRIIDQLDNELRVPPYIGIEMHDPEIERSLEVVGRVMAQAAKEYEAGYAREVVTAIGRSATTVSSAAVSEDIVPEVVVREPESQPEDVKPTSGIEARVMDEGAKRANPAPRPVLDDVFNRYRGLAILNKSVDEKWGNQ